MAQPTADTPKLERQLPGFTAIVAGHVLGSPGVAWLELARPQRHNAFHQQLWEEFPAALQALDSHEQTRVIVISAQGKNFCAGIDVSYLQASFARQAMAVGASTSGNGDAADAAQCPGRQRAAIRRSILALQEAYSAMERCAVPVVAAVHGSCIGGGVDLITAADLRICSSSATFCVKEVDLAIAADLGTLQRLPHIVGHGAACDLAMTGRTINAEDALRIGLVSSVVPADAGSAPAAASGAGSPRGALVAAALALGAQLAAKPSLALQGTKRVLLHARDHPAVADGLDYVATWNSAMLISRELRQAMGPRGTVAGGAKRSAAAPASKL